MRTTLDNITLDSEGVLIDGHRIGGHVMGSEVRIIKHEFTTETAASVTLTLYTKSVNLDNAHTYANIVVSHE